MMRRAAAMADLEGSQQARGLKIWLSICVFFYYPILYQNA